MDPRSPRLPRAPRSPRGRCPPRQWTAFVKKKGEGLLANEVDSWMTGVNQNVEGKNVRIIARYGGTAREYRAWCDRVAAGGYRDLELA